MLMSHLLILEKAGMMILKTTEVVTTESQNMFDWLYPYADKLRFPDQVIETRFRQDYHANTISTTRETYELVWDEFECEYIGEIAVKGKGRLEVWHLLAEKEERSLSHA